MLLKITLKTQWHRTFGNLEINEVGSVKYDLVIPKVILYRRD
jgi:hypothetical protein